MRKRLMILGIVVLVLLLAAGGILGVRAARKLSERKEEAEKERLVTPIPTLPAATPIPTLTAAPTPQPEREGYEFYGFSEQLEDYMSMEQIAELQKQTGKYLDNSLIHRSVSNVICTEFVEEDAGKKQLTGYLQLDDNSLLKFVYDFNRDTITLMDTVSSMEDLQAGQERKTEQELSEEEKKRQEEMTQWILEQEAQAEQEAARQAAPTPTPIQNWNSQGNISNGYGTGGSVSVYPSYTQPQQSEISGSDAGDASQEQIDPETLWEDQGEEILEEPDWDAIAEEQIPLPPVFTDGE
mgnify:CR=1 FL=1